MTTIMIKPSPISGFLIVTLKSYLETLKEAELIRPEQERRVVPSLKELAEAAGVTKATITRLANGEIRALSFEVGAGIITELRARGFSTEVGDILTYRTNQ